MRFGELIRLARKQHGERVVVLVDEYDKPILDNLADAEYDSIPGEWYTKNDIDRYEGRQTPWRR